MAAAAAESFKISLARVSLQNGDGAVVFVYLIPYFCAFNHPVIFDLAIAW